MMRFLNPSLFLSLFSLLGSSLCGSMPTSVNNSFEFAFSDYDMNQAYSWVDKSLTSESDREGCKRGPRGKTGHQGKRGFQGSGTSIDGSLTVSIDDFPIPLGDFPHPAGDFTFNIILITPDGREVGTPVFRSSELPSFPVLLTLPAPLYTGTYLLTVEVVSVDIPGSLGFLATTSNTADTNVYGIQSGISGTSSLIGQRATLAAFAVP